MTIAQVLAAAMLTAEFSYKDEFKTDQVGVRLGIRSNDYVYAVANRSYEPITYFRVPQYSAYAFTAPEGWTKNVEQGVYEAWTDDHRKGVQPGKALNFGLRVKSEGAVLRRGAVRVRFDSGRTVSVPGVLHPALEGGGYIFAVAAIGLALVGLHLLLVIRAGRRGGDTPANDG
ncbi:MAG: hypothetical protein ACYS5V_06865 [Planctomycetota bacterium]